ncbi:phosphomevalonate kinase [Curtobacterium sp. RRHDQ10]|uniref:phosphomevalonate kinase n=1 Tax=Curtobacterium phyllosphaerae TaxID=3413379 RepID=UPI003BF23363
MTAGTSSAAIEVRAPGKLFIAGEYAVVEPGQPSVLVALDRFITVRLTAAEHAGSVHSDEYGQLPLVWTRDESGLTIDREHHPYDYVMAVVDLVERLREERGVAPRFSDLRITSELDDASGRKFGLGSSAAVVVATVGALDAFYRLGLTRRERFGVALLATVQVNPTASGGDLAASTYGGWIRYSAPDRAALSRLIADRPVSEVLDGDHWDGFSVTQLAPPEHLRLLVGWTGSPASTSRLVDVVHRHRDDDATQYAAFLDASRSCVDDLVAGLQSGDTTRATGAITRARGILQRLGTAVGSSIETPRLATLCDVAEAEGAAAKPSGAGGGDCGIVLVPKEIDPKRILRAWEAHDIRHLSVSVHPAEADPVERTTR